MSLIAAYLFNEYPGSGVPASILDWSPNGYTCNALSNIAFAAEADGYDAVFGNAGRSYISSSTFNITGQSFTIALKIKVPYNTFYLVNYPGVFNVQINSSGQVKFGCYTNSTTVATVTTSTAINDGNYHTVQCCANGTTMYVYIDGALATSGACVYTTLQPAGATLIIGAQTTSAAAYFVGNLNYALFYTSCLSLNDSANLAAADNKGMDMQGAHSFEAGDLLGNSTQSIQGVVTYVSSGQAFTVLPYGPFNATNVYKYGNLFNNLRQSITEIDNDFDGNGNAQFRVKYPVTSFGALYEPKYAQTWDYRGLTNVPGSGLTWLMEYQARPNIAGKATDAYRDVLDANMLGTDGDYATFRYVIKVNATGGTVKVIMNNTTLATFTPGSTGAYEITGEITATGIVDGNAEVFITLPGSSGAPAQTSLSLNFQTQNILKLQLNSSANNDIVALRATGIIYNTNIGN